MSLIKKTKDKKVNFEFNKEYLRVVTSKIADNDAKFINDSFNEMHPADAADIIEHLSISDRESLIKLNNFNIDAEVFVELNESLINFASLLAIFEVTTLKYSLLNSKFTFLSLVFLIKDINVPII